jgi:ligand-binding sensor domain-containing protein
VLHEDRKGNLWIGTNGSGVLKLNKTTGLFQLYRNQKNNPTSISSDIIISALEDKSGTMWFGTYLGGLNQMQGERFVHYFPDIKNPNSLSNKSVYGLVEDRMQNIWIATLGGGIDRLDATRKYFSHHNINNVPGLLNNVILSLYSKDSSVVYLSTPSGINVLNTATNTIMPLFRDQNQMNKLSDLIIYNTLVDRHNQLWIATDNGINVYNPKQNTISYMNVNDGLPTDQVVSLVEDNSGNVWAGTRNGLACIYCNTNPTTHKYEYSIVSFDENDGLPSSIMNQNAVFKDKQGKIYIGSTMGYTVFDPKTIHFNKIVPEPRFTEILIGNDVLSPGYEHKKIVILDESITLKNRIELNYNDKNFTINFSALSYIHP